MKIRLSINFALLIISLFMGCKKDNSSAPVISAASATNIEKSAVTLNGIVNAGNELTVVTFDYGTTTGYGSTINAAPNAINGMQESVVTALLTGLTEGTTYHFRIKAVNSRGTTLGEDYSFSTTKPPTIISSPATSVSNTAVTLNGSVNANDLSTAVSFEYGLTTTYGSTIDASPASVTGNTSTNVTASLTGLTQGTLYHFRIKAVNTAGISYGDDLTFSTTKPPASVSSPATSISVASATLNGSVNANDLPTTVSFEYGLTTSYGSTINASPTSVTGNTSTNVTGSLTGLTQGTLYHFRIKAVNTAGTSYGDDLTFSTMKLPASVSSPATSISNKAATLNGSVNANDLPTTVSFEYGLTTSYGSTINASPASVTGNTSTNVTASVTDLTQGTLYHFRIKAVNTAGISYGDDLTFSTTKLPASVSSSATSISGTSATLNGSVNANDLPTTVSFEYGLTTSYGSTIDASPASVTGNTSTNVTGSLTGLTHGTLYHFRIKAVNSAGTSYGNDLTFSTTKPPVSVSSPAKSVSCATATLYGSVNANDLTTAVSFEYGLTTSYGSTINASPASISGNASTSVTASVTGLTQGSLYHFRIKAVSSAGTSFGDDLTFNTTLPLTDVEGNIYNVVVIGTQIWMAENLKTIHYNDGTAIPLITDVLDWSTATTPSYSWYNHDPSTFKNTYGALYNWYVINSGKLCPSGWHVPTNTEWTSLSDYLGGESIAGKKLKEPGSLHWISPTTQETNESGFTALPGGSRWGSGVFGHMGIYGSWWSSTQTSSSDAWKRSMQDESNSLNTSSQIKQLGFSVRCIKD